MCELIFHICLFMCYLIRLDLIYLATRLIYYDVTAIKIIPFVLILTIFLLFGVVGQTCFISS
jgi:hypothetical protein